MTILAEAMLDEQNAKRKNSEEVDFKQGTK